jgi:hypothetical protein
VLQRNEADIAGVPLKRIAEIIQLGENSYDEQKNEERRDPRCRLRLGSPMSWSHGRCLPVRASCLPAEGPRRCPPTER